MPPSLADPAADALPGRWRRVRLAVRWLGGVVFAAWSLLLIAWLILHWGILPNAREWRPQIETQAARALGVPVSIGDIRVQSSGWVPAVELVDVTLRDADGRAGLHLPRVVAALSARSLWTLDLRFEQLLIEGAQLEVRRDALGRLHVAGLAVGGQAQTSDTQLADWFFSQHEFVVRDARVRWTDEMRLAPPLDLADVDIVVRNSLRRHDLRIDATPPPAWGDRFTLQGRFSAPVWVRSGDWQRWHGTLHANLPRADVAELRRHVTLPFELLAGDGALRAWADVAQGRARAVTVDVAMNAVDLRLASRVEPLSLREIRARLAVRGKDDRLEIDAANLAFATADGLEWPASDFALVLDGAVADGQPALGGRVTASRLDLGLMARIAEQLPLGDALRQALASLAPEGVVDGLQAQWRGSLDAPAAWQVRAGITGLGIRAAEPAIAGHTGRPGWRSARVQFQASEAGGTAALSIQDGSMTLPGVFEPAEVPLDRLTAQIVWRVTHSGDLPGPPRIDVDIKNAEFANADAEGEFRAAWHTGADTATPPARGARFPGVIDLSGKLVRGRAVAVHRYIPLVLPETRSYLSRALRDGRVESATVVLQGDLWDFPFHDPGEGQFRVEARVVDVDFDYVPSEPGWVSPWPGLGRASADLVFDRASMEVRNGQGRIAGVDLQRVNGGIRALHDRPVLALEGQGRGAAADLLRFVDVSPVGQWIDGALKRTSATGAADLRLALELPLRDIERGTARGSVLLAGNDVRLAPEWPLLAGARARIDFGPRGFAIVAGGARVFGGEATFEGGTQPDGSLRFTGQGVATADALRRAGELPALARAAQWLSGQAAYQMRLGIVQGQPELSVTSTLAGMAIDLPAPLRKAAEAPLPMRFQTALLAADAAQAPAGGVYDRLRFELGTMLQAQYVRDLSGPVATVLRGGIGVLDAAPQPPAGVTASLAVPLLDVDTWRSAFGRAGAASGGPGATGATVGTDAFPDLGPYSPTAVALRVRQLVADGRVLNDVVAGLSYQGAAQAWRATVQAAEATGFVEVRLPAGPAQPGRIYARLARLTLPPVDAQRVEAALQRMPASVPALDIEVGDLVIDGRPLGRVAVEAANRVAADGSREWRLTRLEATVPEAQLQATGQWIAAPSAGRRRMELEFRLTLLDSGALLERMGFGRVVRGGKGRAQGTIGWAGSPLNPDLPSLGGELRLDVDAGQFLKAGPGAGRLLSVLSLQSLPRRLALDFRDLFQEGFVFDNVGADIRIDGGVARTNNLRMRGLQAAVLMAGEADIAAETQDIRVLVVPEINAGTASLAYAAINPAVGLGTFVAQLFLRRPLMAASTREFQVSGSWDDPKVVRIERPLGRDLPDIEAPAAAASSAPAAN